MVSVKLLVLIALVAIATASPSQTSSKSLLPWQVTNTVNNVLNTATGLLGGTSVQVQAGPLFVSLEFFSRGIEDHNSKSYKALRWVGRRKNIHSYNDVLDILFTITKGVDDLLNKGWISGIGDLLSRLIIATFRISDCVLGDGYRSPHGRDDLNPIEVLLCSNPNYGEKWGWKPYRGSYRRSSDIIQFYKLDGVVKQLRKLLQTKGGLINLHGYPKHVSQALLNISIRFDSRRSSRLSRNDVNYILAQLVKIVSLVTDSLHPNLGKYVANELLNLLNNKEHARPYGLNLSGLLADIEKIISLKSHKPWLSGIISINDEQFYNATNSGDQGGSSSSESEDDDDDDADSDEDNNPDGDDERDDADSNDQGSRSRSRKDE